MGCGRIRKRRWREEGVSIEDGDKKREKGEVGKGTVIWGKEGEKS